MNRSSNTPQKGRVALVAEVQGGRLAPVTWELVTCGRELARALGLGLVLVVLGERAEALGEEAARFSGEAVVALKAPGLTGFHGEAQSLMLERALPALGFPVVVGAQTTSGPEWAPGLAVGRGAAFISGVESIEFEGGRLLLGRAGHHGRLREKLEPVGEGLVITVQPGAFVAAKGCGGPAGAVEVVELERPACRTRVEERPGRSRPDAALTRAEVVVAAGRGVGGRKNLGLLRRLAALFGQAALAGSRPVCELGWLGFRSQVGQTGVSVSPRLYIACGISGAVQHLVGVQGSEFVVAINSDPAAPIFNHCDVGVVEDLTEFIPALVRLAGGD